jgi:hypothetical protein
VAGAGAGTAGKALERAGFLKAGHASEPATTSPMAKNIHLIRELSVWHAEN